jgi:hypothetical protein
MDKRKTSKLIKQRMPDGRLLVVKRGDCQTNRLYGHNIGRTFDGKAILGWVTNPLHAQNYTVDEATEICTPTQTNESHPDAK